ncbi:hypothetical protein [Phenylobacterium sp.]|uniref:hypothetical protein n=1 Tax=Phenylobacterium sp. TaxID=1871053 RepID=UPI00374CC87F
MYVKYAGLTADAAEALERYRASPSETESDIIIRKLGRPEQGSIARPESRPASPGGAQLDLGQGIQLRVGETAYLYLSKTDMLRDEIAATALVTDNGLRMNGRVYGKFHGSYVQQPMKEIQRRLKHVNNQGKLISLSAYRQWYVLRDRTLVPIESLKNAALARTRLRAVDRLDLGELGLT